MGRPAQPPHGEAWGETRSTPVATVVGARIPAPEEKAGMDRPGGLAEERHEIVASGAHSATAGSKARAGISIPCAFNSPRKRGLTPVAWKRPWIWWRSSTPSRT